jgi:glucose-6-phosphate isomerase
MAACPKVHGATFEQQWAGLVAHQQHSAHESLQALFAADPNRFGQFSYRYHGLLIDHSKQRIVSETIQKLIALAESADLPKKIGALFAGEKINFTEKRAVQHMALRSPSTDVVMIDGVNVMPEVMRVRKRMATLAEAVRGGSWRGFTGQKIETIINIGIGGSDLGPRMVCGALNQMRGSAPQVRFVANVDPADLARALVGVQPANTLFIVASKTFTTQETLANASAARAWLRRTFGPDADISRHFMAVTAYPERAVAFGIPALNIYPMWDWVGGRYSLWSAVGLSIALGVGAEAFEQLLAGAADMDAHFKTAPLQRNLPVLQALIGIWNTNFEQHASQLVIPYSEPLSRLPAYLQQLEMESNGKRTDTGGHRVDYATCPALWGEPGTNGQHAFFQWIHQGTQISPVDFIIATKSAHAPQSQHHALIANALAQSRALLTGRESPDGDPHRASPGGRPSTTIVIPELTPFTLGQLIALYEHKVFVQGVIWGINSFDQFGVELGKDIASQLLPCVAQGQDIPGLDGSTLGLLSALRNQ